MKLYKTSYFKEIKEIEVISFDEKTFTVMASIYNPHYYNSKNDRTMTKERYGSMNNFHESYSIAKNFVLMQLSEKIRKMELDLDKYKSIVPKFQ